MDLTAHIRSIPDHPKPGILFRDITILLGSGAAFREGVDRLAAPFLDQGIEVVAAIEARGFILGGAVAHRLGVGFVPLRKPGKLPAMVLATEYVLEYGVDRLEMHVDAVRSGQRVLLIDDLIATGGTAEAGIKLIRQAGGDIVGAAFVIDLPDLGGAAKVRSLGVDVTALLAFPGH